MRLLSNQEQPRLKHTESGKIESNGRPWIEGTGRTTLNGSVLWLI